MNSVADYEDRVAELEKEIRNLEDDNIKLAKERDALQARVNLFDARELSAPSSLLAAPLLTTAEFEVRLPSELEFRSLGGINIGELIVNDGARISWPQIFLRPARTERLEGGLYRAIFAVLKAKKP